MDTNINYPTYNGNVSSLLGKQLQSGDFNALNSSFGYDPARSNYNFTDSSGNIYSVTNNNNGTRSVNQIDTVSNRQNEQNTNNFNNMVSKDDQSVTDFLGQYKNDVGNAITTANSTFNLSTLESAVTGLTNRITDLSNNTSNSAGGAESGTGLGGVNSEAQVGSELNNREIPQLNAAQSNLNTGETLAQNQENIALQPDQAYEDLLKTNITTAMSGLTATQQTEMQGIIAKLNAGVTLTSAEIQAGESYASTILTNANNITLQTLKNAYTPIGQGNTLVNPSNGQIINPGVLAASGAYTPTQ